MTIFNQFWSILITRVLNCASDRLAISLTLCCISSGALSCSYIQAIFLVSAHLLCSKGWSLRCSPGQGNSHPCIVMLYVGEGSEREQCCLLGALPVFSHFLCYPQSNWALLVLIPRWVGLCTFEDSVGLSNELFCGAESVSHFCLNPHRCFQSEV